MMLVSDYFMNMILDEKFRAQSATAISAVYLGLFKAVPIEQTASPASEVSGGAYARKQITFGTAAANARILSTAAIQFDLPTADWATASSPVVAVAVMDASSSGNWLVAMPICAMIIVKGQPVPPIQIGGIKIGKLFGGC